MNSEWFEVQRRRRVEDKSRPDRRRRLRRSIPGPGCLSHGQSDFEEDKDKQIDSEGVCTRDLVK